MLIEFLEANFRHEDDRGSLIQLVREGYRQINVISSSADTLRGDHYHALNTEAFYVISGSFVLDVHRDGTSERYVMNQGEFFQIPPMTVHSFSYLEDTLLVGMYDRGVEMPDGSKDILPGKH